MLLSLIQQAFRGGESDTQLLKLQVDLPGAHELQLAQFDARGGTFVLDGCDALVELFDNILVRRDQDRCRLIETWKHDLDAPRHGLARQILQSAGGGDLPRLQQRSGDAQLAG